MFAALLTVLTNLMGAASAVLLLPNLSWIETEKVPQQMFDGIAISQAPQNETLFANDCSNAHLLAGNFSCTSDLYGPSLDEWAAKAQSSIKQSEQPNGVAILATSQASAVQFALNASDNLKLIWIANRQVLRDISVDYLKAIGLNDDHSQVNGKVDTGSADPRFNNSLETRLQRTGPSIGVQANCFAGNVSVTLVGKEKEIHCFSHWSLDGAEDHYTKCLRIGRGFNGNNNQSTFSLGGSSSLDIKPATSVDSFSSDLATFYNSTADFGSGIARCLLNDTAPTCDWDKIFATPLPPELHNSSVNVGLISYSISNAPNSQTRVYCDSITYLGFPIYSLDTSISSNELNLVQLDHLDVTDYNKPLVVNPDWFLAAWSVNRNGTEDGTRLITREMRRAVNLFWYDQSAINSLQMFFYHVYALGQAMSMVNYYHFPPTSGQTPESQEATDPDRPIFTTWAQLHVWAWGLDGRLSKFGVVITVLGCICVIARVVLGLCVARREYSAVEILVAALEQKPEGVFEGMERERDMARVRYMVRDESDGRLGLGPASGS